MVNFCSPFYFCLTLNKYESAARTFSWRFIFICLKMQYNIISMTLLNKKFVLLGPPGSGKGTQAKILADKLAVPHISTGDIFRDHISHQTDLGKQAEAVLKEGNLMPDSITNSVIAVRLGQSDCQTGFILDGYPRNLAQAEFLYKIFPRVTAIYITLSDEEVVKRISGRRLSKSTGAIYHIEFNPPPSSLPIDDLIVRPDEKPEVVRQRLKIYRQEIKSLGDFYKAKNLLVEIDGTPPIQQVTEQIIKVINT